MKNFHASLDIATEHDLKIPKAVALRNIGRAYAEEHFNGRDLNEAKVKFEASLNIVVEAGVQQLELEVRRELASILEQMGDFEHALKMYREFYEMERRLISEQAEEQTRAIEVRYAVEKNEAALKHEQEIRKRVASELESEREHLRSLTVSIEMKNAALRDTSKALTDLAADLSSTQAKTCATDLKAGRDGFNSD